MSRVEELKSMTQEELVRLVQELEEKVEESKKNVQMAWTSSYEANEKYNSLKAAIKGILDIAR